MYHAVFVQRQIRFQDLVDNCWTAFPQSVCLVSMFYIRMGCALGGSKGDVLLHINDKTEAVNLMWSGRETVAHAIEAVQRQARVEIALPASFHHALFSRLYPDADAATLERVDEAGGTELLAILASLSGLEAMAELEAPLTRSGYRLHLVSPGPVLSLIPPRMA